MPAQGIHAVTEQLETEIAKYTGAPYCLCFDNASSAIYLALCYENIRGKEISMPERTYMSAACEVINAGGKIVWEPVEGKTIKGAYQFKPTRVWDSALYFSADMYIPNSLMCISFTGAYKTFKLSKGGAVILDDKDAYEWLKKARNSGRGECSYHVDKFTMLGKNNYMMPELAARGVLLMQQFYNLDGSKVKHEPVELPYPKLSDFPIYSTPSVEQQEIEILNRYVKFLLSELKNDDGGYSDTVTKAIHAFELQLLDVTSKRKFE